MGDKESTTGNPNGITPTASSTDSPTSTPTNEGAEKLPDGVIVEEDGTVIVVNGKKFVVQDKVNSLVGTARTEGKTAGKTEAEKEAERLRQSSEAQQLQEQGQYKTLYEQERDARLAAEKDTADLRSELEKGQKESQRQTVAAKYGIPAALIDRIKGDTVEDMEKDASDLAKFIKATEVKPVDTQSGGNANTANGDTGHTPDKPKETKNRVPYAFQSKNEVSW